MAFSNEIMSKTKAWPFEQARNLQKRLFILEKRGTPHPASTGEGKVVFETGYGPSGLPHIGTFGEIARTTMVRQAFIELTDGKIPTELIAFSDDMDGMRKLPDNVPNHEMLEPHMGKPLSDVPDPFGTHESFAAHNNAMLCQFLDQFGFDYTFMSSTKQYRSGRFDETLLIMLERFDKILEIMLPTLGAERRASYSPFLPISPTTGRVLQVPTLERNVKKGTIVFEDEDGSRHETLVTGGRVKIQWKPDWALRWAALGVDYEMAGKDLIDSTKISGKICRALGGTPPEGFNYEMFNDENGQKISKTKGNGIAVEDWLKYGTPESLHLFMYQKPKTAKRLYFDVIPKAVDEYYQHLAAYPNQDEKAQIQNPVWYIHGGKPPTKIPPISYAMLLNLVSAANASDKDILWGFIERAVEGANPKDNPELDKLCDLAVAYYQDFVKPNKSYRLANEQETKALQDLANNLAQAEAKQMSASDLQTMLFSIGKEHGFENLREWFKALYEVLLGQSQGPRFGSFIAIYGVDETRELIEKALKADLLA